SVYNQRQSSTGQWSDDNRQFCTCCGIAVTTGTAHDIAVGIGVYVNVKVKVNLSCTQQNNVQIINTGTLAADTCILSCRNFHVFWIGTDGFNCFQVKALYVQQS